MVCNFDYQKTQIGEVFREIFDKFDYMKLLLTSIITIILLYSCSKDVLQVNSENCHAEFPMAESFNIGNLEKRCNTKENISIRITSVEDQRCPFGALCVWEGYGNVGLVFENENKSVAFHLATVNQGTNLHRDTIIDDYKIEIDRIYPEQNKGTLPQQEYSVDIIVTKP